MRDYGYQALFDESGTERDSAYCVVAGFIGTVKQWHRFEKVWGKYGTAPAFHAQRFFSRNPRGERVSPYKGWTDKRAGDYFCQMLRAIGDAKITPIVRGIDLAAFWGFSEEERHKLTGAHVRDGEFSLRLSGAPTKPYYWPFEQVLSSAVNWVRRTSPDMGVYFSFDENRVLQKHALTLYRRMKDNAKSYDPAFASRMKGIIFESDSDNVGLQAADLLSYSWFQYMAHGYDIRPELHRAFDVFGEKDMGDRAHLWTKEKMQQLLAIPESTWQQLVQERRCPPEKCYPGA